MTRCGTNLTSVPSSRYTNAADWYDRELAETLRRLARIPLEKILPESQAAAMSYTFDHRAKA